MTQQLEGAPLLSLKIVPTISLYRRNHCSVEPPASSRDVASVGRCTRWTGIVGKNSLVQQFSLASKLDIGGPVSLAHPCCPSWHEWASIYKSSGKSLSAHKWGPERRQRPGPKQGTKSRIMINNNNNATETKWKGT